MCRFPFLHRLRRLLSLAKLLKSRYRTVLISKSSRAATSFARFSKPVSLRWQRELLKSLPRWLGRCLKRFAHSSNPGSLLLHLILQAFLQLKSVVSRDLTLPRLKQRQKREQEVDAVVLLLREVGKAQLLLPFSMLRWILVRVSKSIPIALEPLNNSE